ncbi:hypothetical protein NM208_g2182 [Fusarium decemcellulare]|uniref:Uncharacterized protein n=1 Tax=Fusarium decemcellulare TaxID=57161 RepID=A0ACC1STB3_9HYPO|nr:hypothetical protein NM208_g2182 [Fusarium decemcellulare]
MGMYVKKTASHFGNIPRAPGKVEVRVTPQATGSYPGPSTLMLFEQSRTLSSRDSKFPINKIDGNKTCYPFEFVFPSLSQSSSSIEPYHLPPSLDIRDSRFRIRVTYSISITVERRGWKLARKRATQELPFTCGSHITDLPTSYTASLPITKLCPRCGNFDGGLRDPNRHGWLPSYSPSLQVELILPQPPVLAQGRATPVQLVVHTPPDVLHSSGEVHIRSVDINLETSVTAHLGPHPRHVLETRQGCNINGSVNVDCEHFQLDLGAWGSFFAPGLCSTYCSDLLQISHTIHATVGLSHDNSDAIQYVDASLETLVMDPPPAYEAADCPRVSIANEDNSL